ncbi:MAG: hypothetical protein AAFU61_12980 [Pseudomonadota bacterium]
MKRRLFVAASAAMLATPAAALRVRSTFDNVDDGRVGNGVSLDPQASDGDPGGCLRVVDSASTFGTIEAPAAFLGTPFGDDGEFHVDARNESQVFPDIDSFGTVTLSGGGVAVAADIAPPGEPSLGVGTQPPWIRCSTPLTAAAFGATDQAWATLQQGLSFLSIEVGSFDSVSEQPGIDNAAFNAPIPRPPSASDVPLPGALPRLGAGLGALLPAKRRRRV